MPRYRVGTSGYNYPEWKGSFYPEKFPQKKMLPYYAERLDTVEINYTFYRLPTQRLLAGWSAVTPAGFRFTLKAPRRITHEARLADCTEITHAFCRAAETLGDKRGALLFQLPPVPDVPQERRRARAIPRHVAGGRPRGLRVQARLVARSGGHGASGGARGGAVHRRQRATADAGSRDCPARLFQAARPGVRSDADLARWAETIARSTGDCQEVYVYFKHEERGAGPDFAKRLLDRLATG